MIGWLMNEEQLVESELAGEMEGSQRKPAKCHFVHHRSHVMCLRLEFEVLRWEADRSHVVWQSSMKVLKESHTSIFSTVGAGSRFL
jgi:hypothetical protein